MVKFGKLPLFSPDRIIAIGDLHGEFFKLKDLFEKIEPHITRNTHIVFLGDLINRGGNSPKTLTFLTEIHDKYPGQVFFVRGNHDWMLMHYVMTGATNFKDHLVPTLNHLKSAWKLTDIRPETIEDALADRGAWNWLEKMLPYYETEEVICTHAPIKTTTALLYGIEEYVEDYKNREDDFSFKYFLDKIIYNLMWDTSYEDDARIDILIPKLKICGHQFKHHNQPRIFKKRAFIDTGCGWRPKSPVTALIYPGKKIIQSIK